jgi:hypothetical protein
LAASGDTNDVAILDLSAGKTAIELSGATDRVTAMAWSTDGQQLATGSRDTHLRLYDVRAKKAAIADHADAHGNTKGFTPVFVPRYGAVGTTGVRVCLLCAIDRSLRHEGEPICTVGLSKASDREVRARMCVILFDGFACVCVRS